MDSNFDGVHRTCSRRALIACLIAVLFSGVAAQTRKPISESGLLEALRIGGLSTSELLGLVQRRGVDFELTAKIEANLRKAGASPELIRAVGAGRRTEKTPVRPAQAAVVGAPVEQPSPPRVSLGLSVQDVTQALASAMGLKDAQGVYVNAIGNESLAERAGVKQRDVITSINNAPVRNTEDMRRQIAALRAGEVISLTIVREGSMRNLTLVDAPTTLAKKQEEQTSDRSVSGKGKLGLRVEPVTPETTARFSLSNAKGLVVMDVDSSGPASAAGIKVGDVIEEINGLPVRALADVGTALAKTNSGRAQMRIKRGGKSLSIDLLPRM